MKYNENTKKKEEIEEIYENNNWTSLMEHKYPKLEAQILITIYNLVMNQDNNKKYEMTEYRQNQLLRLRKFFSDTLYDKIPQMGIVVIEDNVEIGANTCVDRSTMGQTIIHQGVKLDNLIQVAHNCEIGENTVMSAQVGMAGSTKIGAWCMVGGQAGFAGHIQVADKTMVGAQCGVISNTKGNGENLIGSPAMDPKDFFKAKALYRRLPDMYKEISALRKEIEELKKK